MEFKKKAGLALALAAIFTTGGANMALASDNSTASAGGTITAGDADAPLAITGGTGAITVTTSAGGNTVTDITVDESVTKLSITSTTANPMTISGEGGALLATKTTGTPVDLEVTGPLNLKGGSANHEATLTLGNSTDADLTVADGTYAVNKLVAGANAGSDITVAPTAAGKNASLTVGELSVSAALTNPIKVGNDDGAGVLNVGTATLLGSMIFADPSWRDGVTVKDSSGVAIDDWAASKVDGKLVAGRNSTITLGGVNSDWIQGIVGNIVANPNTDREWGPSDITAALAVTAPQIINATKGSIVIDGALTAAPSTIGAVDTLYLANNSLTAFDLSGMEGSVVLKSDTPPFADVYIGGFGGTDAAPDGTEDRGRATVYFDNAKASKRYTIVEDMTAFHLGNNTTVVGLITAATGEITFDQIAAASPVAALTGSYWMGENLIMSSELLTGTMSLTKDAATKYHLVLNVAYNDKVDEVYPMLSSGIGGMVGDFYADGKNNTAWDATKATSNAGIAFVSRATDNSFMPDHTEAAAVLEGAAQIAVAAGVPAVTGNVMTKLSTLIVDHNNILNDSQPAYGNEPGAFGIWLNPFYGMSDVDGMDAGKFENGYDINYGGAAFGFDYNLNEAFRLGLALTVGGGDSESQGDFSNTENDFDFFGASLYGSYTNGAFGLTGDVGFTGVDNDIKQDVPAAMGMSNLESQADSDAFTVGLTGQYRITTATELNITPHLGLRYTKISTDDAKVKLATGQTVFDVATEDQNLFQIPLGVEFSKNITTESGWTFTPSADLGVLFTTGDTDVESRATIFGTGFTGRTNSDVVDSAAFTGKLGFKAAADNGLSLGLDYGILASGNQTDHQFSGMLRFEF